MLKNIVLFRHDFNQYEIEFAWLEENSEIMDTLQDFS